MDNLTHSLVGAVLGQAGLKKKTGLGMATLIIAANIPDIDAVATLLGGVQHLAIRRGITHGPIAMLVLPLVLTAMMIGFDRWQARRGTRPDDRLPIHRGWLLALAFVGTLSHPAMDWLNSYGVRLLEPFSSRWFYGDSIFIIDIWIWMALIAGVWISRRREKRGTPDGRKPAVAALGAMVLYIGVNGLITNRAKASTTVAVESMRGQPAELVVANNIPVLFWARQMLWRGQGQFGSGSYSLFGRGDGVTLDGQGQSDRMKDVDWPKLIAKNSEFKAFLFWSRMPYLTLESDGEQPDIALRDQRFDSALVGDRFAVRSAIEEN